MFVEMVTACLFCVPKRMLYYNSNTSLVKKIHYVEVER